jgi:hypothetical protein
MLYILIMHFHLIHIIIIISLVPKRPSGLTLALLVAIFDALRLYTQWSYTCSVTLGLYTQWPYTCSCPFLMPWVLYLVVLHALSDALAIY